MTTMASKTWGMWIVRGIASVLFGVLTLLRPGASIGALVFLYGFYALSDGALLLGFAFRQEGRRALYVIRGLFSVGAGVIAFLFPGLSAIALYILIGAWAVTSGLAEIAIAIAIRKDATGVGGLVVAGVLSLLCGVALLALPLAGVVALVGLIAAYAIFNGMALIAAGIRIHGVARSLQAT